MRRNQEKSRVGSNYTRRWIRPWILVVVVLLFARFAAADECVFPRADGTIADGDPFGPFDGEPDDWDWVFNGSSYEGAITRVIREGGGLEHRVVWEYDLSRITTEPPVHAELSFVIRGAPAFGRPDTDVHIYSYPADLRENASDYNQGPTVLQGSVRVAAFQEPTNFRLDVSDLVNASIDGGENKVAFRFQVDPGTEERIHQVFIDANEDEDESKPFLVISEGLDLPGDYDGDGDVDLDDYRVLYFCLFGPDRDPGGDCRPFDFDFDDDVDLADFVAFQTYFLPV